MRRSGPRGINHLSCFLAASDYKIMAGAAVSAALVVPLCAEKILERAMGSRRGAIGRRSPEATRFPRGERNRSETRGKTCGLRSQRSHVDVYNTNKELLTWAVPP